MQYKVTYYGAGAITLGEGSKAGIRVHAELQKPSSQLWFCPVCSDTYLNVFINGSGYIALSNNCENCTHNGALYQTRITLPGSILMEGYNTIEELSDEMLKRELLLELNAMKYLIDKGIIQ